MTKLISIILAVIIASYPLKAELAQFPQTHPEWKNISVDHWRKTVFYLFQDSHDMMWLGTNGGLYYYDGVTTRPISPDNNLPYQIYSIVEHNDMLYLGSNNGLFIYDLLTGQFITPPTGSPNEIRALLLHNDTLWIGSLEGVFALNLNSNSFSNHSDGLPHISTYSLLRDSRGILYAGTYKGLARMTDTSDRFEAINTTNTAPFVNCMIESPDSNSIYIGSEGALFKFQPESNLWQKVTEVENNTIKSLALSKQQNLLVGTDNGLFEVNKNEVRHFRHDSRNDCTLSDNEIWCVYSDKNDNIWVGHERGFSIASNTNLQRTIGLASMTNSGEGNEIHNIHRDSQGNLWLGGTNGIILLTANGSSHWFRHSKTDNALAHNRIRAITEDSQNNIWLSTDGGIHRFEPKSNSFHNFRVTDNAGGHISNWVYAISESQDYLWIGSYLSGLHYVAKSKFKTSVNGTIIADQSINSTNSLFNGHHIKLNNELVNNVVKDNNDNIWVLLFRDNEITRISNDGTCKKYNILQLTGEYPHSICCDNIGRLWCAFNGGVIIIDSIGRHNIVRYPSTTGNNDILTMGCVGNDMWISTFSNVWRIDGESLLPTLAPVTQQRYTAIYHDRLTNKVFLGGTDELTEVDATLLKHKLIINPIRLNINPDGYYRHCDSENLKFPITLNHDETINLSVSSLDYSPQSIHQYAYKLAKSTSDTVGNWIYIPIGVNTIYLSGLSMGNYQLLIRSAITPGNILTIPLKVKAPWYLSGWALTFYILFTILFALSIFLYLRRRNLRAIHEEERRQALINAEQRLSFLSDISHELKTPLSMIIGPVSILKERVTDTDSRNSLDLIYNNAIKLNNLIHRTLELKQIDSSNENLLILSTFDIVEFCKSIFNAFKTNNVAKKFVFHTEISQAFIEADVVKMESVISNLLSNACKYSTDGSTISMGISAITDKVQIIVADDGVGIAESDQPLVFQRLFRSQATAKTQEGTGIGLYLIKKYLELMNGNIELFSRQGQGTSFTVTIPASNDKFQTTNTEASYNGKNGKPKILIVEDNNQMSSFLKSLLRQNFNCLEASNGRTGLSLAASFGPDLIITDQMMPLMNGNEMVAQLKQNPRLALIPIIMLTAQDDNQTENTSIKLGVDVFIAKPFEPNILTSHISNLIETRNQLRHAARIASITEAKPIEAESHSEKQVAKIANIIEENISDPDLNVNMLCELSGISNKQLYRIVKKYIGLTPLDYIRSVRLQKAAMLLNQHSFSISEVCYMVGFKSPSYFTKCFSEHYGVNPSQYQAEDKQ